MRPLALCLLLAPAGLAAAQSDPASDHYRAGVVHYKEGQYATAISEFRAADAIRPSPVLSFNIAQCYEKMADLANAKAAYLEYLRRAPAADDRQAIEATVASIDQKLAQQQRNEAVVLIPSTVADTTAQARPQPPNYLLGSLAAGVGLAGIGLGILLNALSHQNSDSLQNNGVGGKYWDQPQAQGYYQDAQNLWTGALVAYIAGGVVTAAGASILGYQLMARPQAAP